AGEECDDLAPEMNSCDWIALMSSTVTGHRASFGLLIRRRIVTRRDRGDFEPFPPSDRTTALSRPSGVWFVRAHLLTGGEQGQGPRGPPSPTVSVHSGSLSVPRRGGFSRRGAGRALSPGFRTGAFIVL